MRCSLVLSAIFASVLATAPLAAAQSASRSGGQSATGQPAKKRPDFALAAAKVFTAADENPILNNGIVVVRDGTIYQVGPRDAVKVPDGIPVYDVGTSWVVPGFVEMHNHTAGDIGDLNDMVYLTNPDLRTLDVITPETRWVKDALSGGVTTALLIPGSGTNMSGFGTIVKWRGKTVDEMVLRFPGSIKVAQSGNPERYWYGIGRSFMNWNTRQTLHKGKEYSDKWVAFEREGGAKPAFDPTFDTLRGVFEHKFVASVHTQQSQVILMTLKMLHDEFGLDTMIDHGTFNSYKMAPEVIKRNMFVNCGPRTIDFDRAERKIVGSLWGWVKGGVKRLGVNTDCVGFDGSDFTPNEEELVYQASVGVRLGADDPLIGLRALTINPARSGGIAEKVGSLEKGKDADIGVWTGNPIDPRNHCVRVYIDGEVVYDAERDGQRW